jgi:hypothetical protein
LLLAWIPLLFFIIPSAIGFVALINSHRATGFAVVSAGFAEIVTTFGFAVVIGSQVTAIVMLLRTLSRNRPMRTVVGILSACCSGLLLSLVGLFLWWLAMHRV